MPAASGGYSVTISAVDNASKRIEAINRHLERMQAPVRRVRRQFNRLADNAGLTHFTTELKNMRQIAASSIGTFGRLSAPFAALAGAGGVAGFADLAAHAGAFGTNLLTASQNAGMSVSRLRNFQQAAYAAGGSMDAASGAAQTLNRNLMLQRAGLRPEGGQFYASLSQLGMTNVLHETAGQALPQILKRLAEIPNAAVRAHFAVQILGSSFNQLGQLTSQGATGLARFIHDGEAAGTVTKAQATLLEKMQIQQRRLETSVEDLGVSIMSNLAPAVTKAEGGMAGWLDANRKWLAADISGKITETAHIIAGMARDFSNVTKAIGGSNAAFKSFAELLASFVMPWPIKALLRLDVALRAAGNYIKGRGWTDTDIRTGRHIVTPFEREFGGFPVINSALGAMSTSGRVSQPLINAEMGALRGPRRVPPSHAAFLKRIAPYARKVSAETGVDPKIIEAQAINETGWGAHAPGNNYFGIKGPGSAQTTREFVNGHWVTKRANFAAYPSMPASFAAYAHLIETDPHYKRLRHSRGLVEQSDALQASGYATDPYYGAKIYNIASSLPAAPPAHLASGASRSGTVTHTVKGSANVNVHIAGAPAGTHVTATTDGDLFTGAPKVEMPMPAGGVPN